jgi:energy-coupling factor transport system substrate-specific component
MSQSSVATAENSGWFGLTTREWVSVAILTAFAAVVSTAWSFMLNAGVLGPFNVWFASYGFNIVGFLVLYFVPKARAVIIVKTVGAVIELMLGNPVGAVVLWYGFAEGVGIALAFVLFQRKLSLPMFILGSVFAWAFAAPADIVRDAVPLTVEALMAYFGPGLLGKVWISLLCWLTILGVRKVGIKPSPQTEIVSAT